MHSHGHVATPSIASCSWGCTPRCVRPDAKLVACEHEFMRRFAITFFSVQTARQIRSPPVVSAAVGVQTLQGQLLELRWTRVLWLFQSHGMHSKPGIDMVFQRDVLTTSHRDVLQRIFSQNHDSLKQRRAAHGRVIEDETIQPSAERYDDIHQQLVEGVIARLTALRASIRGSWCRHIGRRLVQAPGHISP